MKKSLILSMVIFITCCVFAQSPQKMSYQFVVRNPSDKLVANKAVGVKISILQGSATGSVVFAETYSPNPQTNANGLVSIEIGGGSALTGTFSAIDWASGPYFLKTETDLEGGTDYTISGTSQLLSVPYAMYAKTAENGFSGSYSDLTNKPFLFSGNYNDLTNKPALFDGAWANITGKPTTLSGYGIIDADGSVTNELQFLSISGTQLSLSNGGGTVTLPSSGAGDNWGSQVAKTNTTLTGEGTESSPLGVANTIITPSWVNVQGKPELAAVATSGSFVDLLSKPTTLIGYGITDAMSTSHASNGITEANITNWNTAYDWGNHAGLYRPVSYVPSWSEITGIPAGFADAVDNVDDADNSITNELQALSISGSSLTLSQGGGTVVIPGDNWGNQTVVTNSTLSGSGTAATPLIIADNGVTSNKIANNAVTVVKLPAGATADNYLRGDGTWAIPSAGSITETDPTWDGDANATGDIGRTGKVGIGTSSPAALLHIYGTGTGEGNVVFDGLYKGSNAGSPPTALGSVSRMMWYPDKTAFRIGVWNSTEWAAANIGNYSIAMGPNTIASGYSSFTMGDHATSSGENSTAMGYGTTAIGNKSTAIGYNSTASKNYSTAIGNETIASGFGSLAMGYKSTASGDYSTVMGLNINALAYNSTAIGRYNVGGGDATAWVDTDPLFEIGNGAYDAARSNAMTVLKNGNVGIGTTSPTALLHTEGTGAGEGNVVFVGDMEVYPGSPPVSGAGTRMMWYPDKGAFRAGGVDGSQWDADNIGRLSIALGSNTIAMGSISTAIGMNTTASGTVSTAMGWSTNASAYMSTAIGRLNVGGGNANNWVSTDPLFEIGNGLTSPSNAMTVLKNGNVGIGITDPAYKLDITGPMNLNKGITEGIALRCNNVEALWYNGTYFSWGYGGTYNYFADPITIGNVTDPTGYALWVQGNAWSTGTFLSSDARYKKNISAIDNALDKLMKVRGTTFEFRTNEFQDYQFAEGPQFGFIAQELENVFPEVVKTDRNGYKSVNYNGMIPILLESIKEQQLQIESQQKQINELKSIVSGLISER